MRTEEPGCSRAQVIHRRHINKSSKQVRAASPFDLQTDATISSPSGIAWLRFDVPQFMCINDEHSVATSDTKSGSPNSMVAMHNLSCIGWAKHVRPHVLLYKKCCLSCLKAVEKRESWGLQKIHRSWILVIKRLRFVPRPASQSSSPGLTREDLKKLSPCHIGNELIVQVGNHHHFGNKLLEGDGLYNVWPWANSKLFFDLVRCYSAVLGQPLYQHELSQQHFMAGQHWKRGNVKWSIQPWTITCQLHLLISE